MYNGFNPCVLVGEALCYLKSSFYLEYQYNSFVNLDLKYKNEDEQEKTNAFTKMVNALKKIKTVRKEEIIKYELYLKQKREKINLSVFAKIKKTRRNRISFNNRQKQFLLTRVAKLINEEGKKLKTKSLEDLVNDMKKEFGEGMEIDVQRIRYFRDNNLKEIKGCKDK